METKRKPRKVGIILQDVRFLASPCSSLYISKSLYDCWIISKVFSRFRRNREKWVYTFLSQNPYLNRPVNNIKWLEKCHPIFSSYIFTRYLLSSYKVPGIILDSGDPVMINKMNKSLLCGNDMLMKEEKIQTSKI